MDYDYELLVIGSGPAGQKAAIQGAKLGKRVAIVERRRIVGGVCVNTGTIPSKTLREAIVYLTGLSQRGDLRAELPGQGGDHDRATSAARTRHVIEREIDVIRDQLAPQPRRSCSTATARFVDPHTIAVASTAAASARVDAPTRSSSPSARGPRTRRTSRSTSATMLDSDGILLGSARSPPRSSSSAPA